MGKQKLKIEMKYLETKEILEDHETADLFAKFF